MQNNKELLIQALSENHLSLSDASIDKMLHFLELLQKWNRVFNLTTITQQKDMIYLHLIDSLIVSPLLHGNRLLDCGSGAGLPGIPLAILNPEQRWVLLDKASKKVHFLIQVIAELQMKNVEVVHSRSENYFPEECFDSILSRAFGTLQLFAESTQHLLCEQGLLIALKGQLPQKELDDLPDNFVVHDIAKLTMAGYDITRHVIRLKRRL
jgi:16S rRNA (guanine527-N7)-methyltransferase